MLSIFLLNILLISCISIYINLLSYKKTAHLSGFSLNYKAKIRLIF